MTSRPHNPGELLALARTVGDDWKEGPYYDEAEAGMEADWVSIIWPVIKDSDFTCVVDLAAGHGRNSEKLRHLTDRLYVVDINHANIEFMQQRFLGATNITYVHNDGISLEAIPNGEATLVYCFDAMVHFDSDVVRAYLSEFNRILSPGGRCFCHYSNFSRDPTGSYRDHPGWRNFMSRELFEHYAWKEGLSPVFSQLIRDGCDAITLLENLSG
jgi:ubiquinone/menaquinone biosynthesis C-methylase UbiE